MRLFLHTTALGFALVAAFATHPIVVHAEGGLQSGGVVTGRIVDGLTGDPVPGASIEAAETGARVEADRKGQFAIPHLPAGRVILVVSLAGYESERTELTVEPDAQVSIEIAVFPSLDRVAAARVELLGEAQRRALDEQRTAPNITTVVAADQLGRFPDGNAAEALQRIAGLSVLLDRGEGKDVLVRGANPRLNSLMLNGEPLPSTHGDRRSVDLDVFPADLLQTVTVAKTALPNADGDGIGGRVNLSMAEIPRRTAWTVSLTGGRDDLTRGFGQGSGTVTGGGRVMGGRLGLFAATSGSHGHRGIDSVLARYGETDPTSISIRKDVIDRSRFGINSVTDYHVSDASTAFLRVAFATYERADDRQTLRYRLTSNRLERDLEDESRRRTIGTVSAGSQHALKRGTAIEYRASLGYGDESRPRDLRADFDRTLTVAPPPVALKSTSSAEAEEAAAFRLDTVGVAGAFSRDRDISGAMNFSMPVSLGSGSLVRAGLKYRTKAKTREEHGFQAAARQPVTLTDFAGSGPTFLGGLGAIIDSRRVSTLVDSLPLVEDVGARAGDYTAREDVLPAYAMLELPLSPRVTVISGARHEYSTYTYTGRSFDGVALRPLRSSNDNGVWLPGVHARYALDHDTIVRGALTRSFARPDFEDLSPFQISDGDNVSMGNPFLEPTVAWNTDVAVERYLRPVGLISVALFHKRLDQQIYSFTTTSTVNGNPIQITQAQNGDAATIAGLELSFQQQLRMLPSPFDSLSVYATYSRTASHAKYPLRSSAPLPGQSRHLGDLIVFYERGGFSGRAAVSFHSQSLARVGRAEANDQFLAGRGQLDLSIAQRVRRRTWVVFDVDNLSDAPDTGFAQRPSRPTSIEHFGRYVTFGLRLAF